MTGLARTPHRRSLGEWAIASLVPAVLSFPAALGGGACVISFAFSVDEVARGAHYELFGLRAPVCPGCAMCGMSRAFAAASHGDLQSALDLNALVVVAYPAVFIVTAISLFAIVHLVRNPIRFTKPRA